MSGCSPAITREDAEKELVSFMLDFIVQQKIEGFENDAQSIDTPQKDNLLNASLIVFLPPNENSNKDRFDYLNFDEPTKVWSYDEHKLEEVADKEKAIQEYQEVYMVHNPNPEDTWSWGFYQFGIMSISKDNKEAMIYLVDSNGPDVAGGMMYYVRRDRSGNWEITDSELLWLS